MPFVLLVDDEEDTRSLLLDGIRRRGIPGDAVESGQACLDYLRDRDVDVVVTDVNMPGMSGVELCARLRTRFPHVLTLVLTGAGTYEIGVEAVRAGAYDFLVKPLKLDALEMALSRAFDHIAVRREVKRLRAVADLTVPIPGMIGASQAMRDLTAMIRNVAESDATVLVSGESGTGKEVVARALHALSPSRGTGPFVAINCGAVPAGLLESELFGHVRGAFTDAKSARPGLFVQAKGGTIFLDEIGEMPLEMQVKLLRVLQERTVRPVGGDEETPFDARVITATNRDLEEEIEAGRFREDLYYRINVVPIEVPPLRDRGSDILLLAEHIVARLSERRGKAPNQIAPDARRKLIEYAWPGNVRELENCIERALAICGPHEIGLAHLPVKIVDYQPMRLDLVVDGLDHMISLEEMERRYVRQVVAAANGNKTHAARILGIDRRSLYRRLEDRATAPPAKP